MDIEINWPMNSVVYHIYVRSFSDTNNDGIGDLQGVIDKLKYLSETLGVTAIWLSPVYPSPQMDYGYDISDYTDIEPTFGDLKTFDTLVKVTHEHGIKVMMDYVPNHTSDQHKWFLESRSSKENSKRDWYIWADPKPDGSPPNNWLSAFGGGGWTLNETTGQYYFHSWDIQQPDLNWRNPKVEEAMLNVLRFWMDRGVDGFRVDAIDWLYKDPLLRDEPPNPNAIQGTVSQYDMQLHPYTYALPETIQVLKRIVNVLKEYKNKFMVAEAHLTLPELIQRYTTVGWKWYQPFNFSLMNLPWRADVHKQFIDDYDKALGDLYLPCWVLGNHDRSRVGTRIGIEQARVAALLQLTLRGIPFIYYGEEIGMLNTEVPKELVVDNYEKYSPGLGLDRAPARTPMQWNNSEKAGFTKGSPWITINENYKEINVENELQDPYSMISFYKALIKLKKQHTALSEGTYTAVPMPADNVLAFIRENGAEKLLILANFDGTDKNIDLDFNNLKIIASVTMKDINNTISLKNFTLKGNEGYVLNIDPGSIV